MHINCKEYIESIMLVYCNNNLNSLNEVRTNIFVSMSKKRCYIDMHIYIFNIERQNIYVAMNLSSSRAIVFIFLTVNVLS